LNDLLSARFSAIQQIKNEFSSLKVSPRELMIDYLFLLPDYCSCEIKPTDSDDNDSLYQHHINSCLNSKEEVATFKNEIISQIRIKVQLLNHKKQVIREIINYSQDKGLMGSELSSSLGNE